MRRLLPDSANSADLGDAELRAAYAPDRSSPRLRLNFVTSLDGAVEVDGYSRGLSTDADRALFAVLRDVTDVVLVGAGTLRHEGYKALRLSPERRAWRRDQGLAEYPTLVVVSSSLELDADSDALAGAPVRPVVLSHGGAPTTALARLSAVADVINCGESVVDLAVGLAELHKRGLSQVLCEGGPHLFGALLAADLVDELCLSISPVLAGAGAGRIVAGGRVAVPQQMELVHVIDADGMLFTRYARR